MAFKSPIANIDIDPLSKTGNELNPRMDRNDQARVIWYQWEQELKSDKSAFGLGNLFPVPVPGLASARSFDISDHISNVTYTKSMDVGGGSFSITVENSLDWAKYVRPGTWIVLMLSPNGDLFKGSTGDKFNSSITQAKDKLSKINNIALKNLPGGSKIAPVQPTEIPNLPEGPSAKEMQGLKKYIRMVGVVQRTAIRSVTGTDGELDISYTISGKDFGITLEETELWFNFLNVETQAFQAVAKSAMQLSNRNLSDLMREWTNIFIRPQDAFKSETFKQSQIKALKERRQWILPDKLISDMGWKMSGEGYFGDLDELREYSPTLFEHPDPNPLAGIEGTAWERLKSLSEPAFHEFFTEHDENGHPKIFFRPIPWAFDKAGYPNIGKTVLEFKNLINPEGAEPPIPINAGFQALTAALSGNLKDAVNAPTIRKFHRVDVGAVEIESFDLGPDFHQRYNFFLVDSHRGMLAQNTSLTLLQKANPGQPFPLQDISDIKRHGFRKLELKISAWVSRGKALFSSASSQNLSNKPQQQFLLEANEIMKDYHGNAEDFFSGTMNISGKNNIKLGKVLVTDSKIEGISDMAFYIEGYTDSFSVNSEGTPEWTQSLELTRGIEIADLNGGSTKDKQPIKRTGTFHKDSK